MSQVVKVPQAALDALAARWQEHSAELAASDTSVNAAISAQPTAMTIAAVCGGIRTASLRLSTRASTSATKVRRTKTGFDAYEADAAAAFRDVTQLV